MHVDTSAYSHTLIKLMHLDPITIKPESIPRFVRKKTVIYRCLQYFKIRITSITKYNLYTTPDESLLHKLKIMHVRPKTKQKLNFILFSAVFTNISLT